MYKIISVRIDREQQDIIKNLKEKRKTKNTNQIVREALYYYEKILPEIISNEINKIHG